ncbi:MAG TPA: M56 family metallopeptidase [Puia sp.]|jgi:beta-lactamase regulating signal transducer with metallopeptidase domain|nr:M56 family metallopeptidase [Puia sp.]
MQVLTHFPLLKALGWALFNSLWQMAAIWLLYCLLIAVFHSAAARIRHGLALLFLSTGALWTGISFFAALLLPENGNTFWLPFLSPAQSIPGWFWQTSRAFMDTVLSYGSTLYLLILSGLLIRYSSHYWHTRKLTRKGLATMPAELRVFVNTTALQLNIRKPVRTWLSSLIDVPVTLGFLKPVILLPAAMISQLTPQQVEAILIHELGHIRRKDYLLHLLVTLLEGLFFFNPFARLLIRQLKKEREHCCDDLVLQFKYDPSAYVSALLCLAARQQRVPQIAVAATGGSDKLLLQRARRILLQQNGDRSRPGIRTLMLLLFTGLITALALYRPLLPARRTALARPTSASSASAAAQPHIAPTPASNAVAATTFTISLQEFAFNRPPIHSTAPPAPVHHHIRPRTPHEPAPVQADNDDIFVNTADDGAGDGDATALIASVDDLTDPGTNLSGAGYRDYSLNIPSTVAGPNITFQQGAPVIPNSSFTFQYTLGDSAQPEEQLLYLQQSAQREVLAAMAKLQEQTAVQLKALNDLRAKAVGSVHLRHQIEAQQQKLQRDYLKKITSWQKKLETTTHIRMIVYI